MTAMHNQAWANRLFSRGGIVAACLCGLLLVLFVRQGRSTPQTLLTERPSANPLYIVQPNDVLQIYVYKEPNFPIDVTVRPDGRISIPLAQDIQAAGLNPGELKQKMEEKLKESGGIEVPNVTVIVKAIQSYRIYILGKVGKPGAIMVEKPINVLQALSVAGGTLEFAKLDELVVFRNSGEDTKLYKINYNEIIKGLAPSQNISLKSGDVLVVP